MSGHTKGPYRVRRSARGVWKGEVVGADGFIVLRVSCAGRRKGAEAEANLALAGASPDMYEALSEIAEMYPDPDSVTDAALLLGRAQRIARAAMAKAEGGAS